MRRLSARLYMTVASLSFLASSFASIHGAVTSMYLLHAPMRAHMDSSASGALNSVMYRSTFSGRPSARAIMGSSSSGTGQVGAGTTPPKYLSIMLTVRESRLPRSFARSEFMR